MDHVKIKERCQPPGPVPYVDAPVCQQTSCNQSFEFFPGGPVNFLPEGTQTQPSMAMTGTQTPEPPPSTFQYYGETLNYANRYSMPPMPVGFFQGGPIKFLHEGTHKMMSMAMSSTQTVQPLPSTPVDTAVYNKDMLHGLQTNRMSTVSGSTGDLTASQLHKPSSSLPQGVAGASAHTPMKPVADALQKRELRLMKNREAARECRRKKKEYVKCLENRVAVLENQNKTLIEELRTLKDIYRHKVE
ncbi:cAMP-responsive element modulator-like isoform X1 [Seriola aureovittata]|uniref:cAMP-responsive element modulator-like isoform X1 n=1 Tax=Seriola aureovittata TaxID=2871759 RepID=UPI0024BDD025|nr:cAMP-responsive element modulator-like isoform X1 [Seriola aureovittata]XP_056219691.1 cAMP-responsive element modulator-like isoform X1 [Seriola aureovittata]XP_056219692.1 cAMP-responsive element modulator-like isoform X1 [Seriola aureovittata]